MHRIRVLMLGWFGDNTTSGGMEIHIREICKNIASEEIALTLVIPKGAICIPRAKNLEIIEIPCTMHAKSIEEVIKNVSGFNKNIARAFEKRGFAFDLIHSHDWLSVSAARNMSNKYGVPWVHTVHSLEHIRAAEETDSKIAKIEKEGIQKASKIITVSRLMKKEIMKKYSIPPKKIKVLGNYLSRKIPDKNYSPHFKRKKTVLFVGRLALQKGVETLIFAFPDVLRSHPDAKLIIAGDGNLKNSLINLARINGIEKHTFFKGHVNENSLSELYRKASIFVSPSLFEPFGITVLDAADSGLPIIATKNTGALEIFSKNSAITVPAQNRKALAENIIALLKDKEMQVELAQSAKDDLLKADNWKEISEKTAEEYRLFLNRK